MIVRAIVGPRNYTPQHEDISRVLEFNGFDRHTDIVVSGGCPSGVDRAVKDYCKDNGYRYLEATCFWTNKRSPHHRNETIAMVCTEFFYFVDKQITPGTASALSYAKKHGKPTYCITPHETQAYA